MSFNIRYPNPGDGIHAWEQRRPLVKSIIQFHEADLIGVQEAYRRQLDEMVADMPEYEWFGVCRTDGSKSPDPDNEFSAIFYRRNFFEFLEGSTFWLSETPDSPGAVGWDAALPRIVTWVKLKDKKSGKEFYHFNTHFDHMGAEARLESAKLLLEKASSIAGDFTVILTGDFNCEPLDEPYKVITDTQSAYPFADAMTISKIPHHGTHATFASNFETSGLSDRRIDYIFIRNGADVLKHAILSDSWDGSFASDHLPVFARLIFN